MLRARAGESVSFEYELTIRSGKRLAVRTSLIPERAADGSVGGSFELTFDITEQKRAEERGLRAARRTAILRAIERRSGDDELNAASIAATLGITPRYVHMLLEETGQSFTHHVLERRLQRMLALLRDPTRRGDRIADLAAEAGFADMSYFNRAFRRRFGATPSDIRNARGPN